MSERDAFERILASMYEAMLDDAHWPATSALIDEACGITGNALMIGEGPKDDIRALWVGLYYRGQRHKDLEREYVEVYHPTDERVPRLRQLADSRLVHTTELYTAEELKISPTYNEALPRGKHQNSLVVRLDGPDDSHISWGLGDPLASSEGWGSSKIRMVKKLLPHIRQFVNTLVVGFGIGDDGADMSRRSLKTVTQSFGCWQEARCTLCCGDMRKYNRGSRRS